MIVKGKKFSYKIGSDEEQLVEKDTHTQPKQ